MLAADSPEPALALGLMAELQRYRAEGGPIGPAAQYFVRAIRDMGAARHGIGAEVLDQLARLASSQMPLDDAELRWVRNLLPELVRQIALSETLSPAPASSGSCPAWPARSHAPPAPDWWSAGSP